MWQNKNGFTLLEGVLILAVIGFLAGLVIMAIDPNKKIYDARNADRRTDVAAILDAVYQYALDHNGAFPDTITTGSSCNMPNYEICSSGAESCSGMVDLSVLTANAEYSTTIPKDPSTGDTQGSGYFIIRNSNGHIEVCAPATEHANMISATR